MGRELLVVLGLMHMIWAGWARWMLDHWDEPHQCEWIALADTTFSQLDEGRKSMERAHADQVIECLRGFVALEDLEAGRRLRLSAEARVAEIVAAHPDRGD